LYDPKNEPHEFVADGREEAVAKAAQYFGIAADALAVHEPAVGEVYGLGGRTAIVAVPKDRRPSPRGGERGDRGDRDRDRDRGAPRERFESRDRGGRGDRDRDRGGRGRDRDRDRGRGGREQAERSDRGGRGDGDRDRGGEQGSVGAERQQAESREPSAPSVGTAQGSLSEAGTYVLGIIERIDVGPFEIKETEEGDLVVYEIRGEAALNLAGGDGRPVDALQLLVNQAAGRMSEDPKRIVLDVEGNAESRDLFLERQAERVISRAREGGRSIALDPMNARDRRIIHLAVREQEGMASMSIGEGRYRQVVVVPEGAPDYDEAIRQSEGASQPD